MINQSYKCRIKTSRVVNIVVDNKQYQIPIEHGVGLDNVYYYKENLFPIVRLISGYKKSGVFIDVGANIGQMLVNMLISNDKMPYVGFEPNVTCCNYINKLIEINSLKKHAVLPIGLSDKSSVVELLFNSTSDVCASTTPMFRPSSFFNNSRKVFVESGDSVISKLCIDDIAIIKIDVEGGEFEVVKGLQQTIGKYKPLILFEVLPYMHIENDSSIFSNISEKERLQVVEIRKQRTSALELIFSEIGYIIYRIEDDGSLKNGPSLTTDNPKQITEINFIAIHNSEQIDFETFVSNEQKNFLHVYSGDANG